MGFNGPRSRVAPSTTNTNCGVQRQIEQEVCCYCSFYLQGGKIIGVPDRDLHKVMIVRVSAHDHTHGEASIPRERRGTSDGRRNFQVWHVKESER